MSNTCKAALVLGLIAGLTSTAHAGAAVVNTPPIYSTPGVDGYLCIATNVGTKAVNVTIDIVDVDSGVVTETSTQAIPPLHGGSVYEGTTGPTSICRVTGLSKKTGTVSFLALDASNEPVSSVTAP